MDEKEKERIQKMMDGLDKRMSAEQFRLMELRVKPEQENTVDPQKKKNREAIVENGDRRGAGGRYSYSFDNGDEN